MSPDFELHLQTAVPVYQQIVQFFENQINTGHLASNTRLPPAKELAKKWGISYDSVQRAMVQLTAQKLIERKPKRGTFVASKEEKAIIGVLIGPSLTDETAYYYRAVLKFIREGLLKAKGPNWTVRVYDGLTELRATREADSSPAYEHFTNDLRHYPFKGIIKLPGGLDDWETARLAPHLPIVTTGDFLHKSDVILDYERFARESVEHLAKNGCRKIVYLRTIGKPFPQDLEGIEAATQSCHLPPVEIHQLRLFDEKGDALQLAAYQKTLELIDQWKTNARPDALLVPDDVVARGVIEALFERTVAAPPRIMAMANEEIDHHYGMPVIRYEFSPQRIARIMLGMLWRRIAGGDIRNPPLKIGGKIKPAHSLLDIMQNKTQSVCA
ncbi:MAG: GntR family transcriptional regulator [Verrucomicrobiae bacterium]|nr:GntR family transcriptional regulator [Verrucomicrobiae bacterium]